MMSLEALANDAGLSLEEILDVSLEEFRAWNEIACQSNVILRAAVFSEWKGFRDETHDEISSLEALCVQAGATMKEVVALSSKDFRQLTKVMNVSSITQHTLLFQEKKRRFEAMRGTRGMSAVGPTMDAATAKNVNRVMDVDEWRKGEGGEIANEQYYADARNDENSTDQQVRSPMSGTRQLGYRNVDRDAASLRSQALSSQDENSLLNDVLMCSHNIDPTGNGQLSLEFVWQLANTQKRTVELIPENEVVFSGGESEIGARRFIKFVKSFRSLYLMSNDEDRQVLAGLLVLVAQTRGYRFMRMDNDTGEIMHVSDDFAKEKTIDILLPLTTSSASIPITPSAINKYARGQTRFTEEEDKIIAETVMTSPEQPFTSWARLAEKLPGYKSKQIRDRWVNQLNPNINHDPFSPKEVSLMLLMLYCSS